MTHPHDAPVLSVAEATAAWQKARVELAKEQAKLEAQTAATREADQAVRHAQKILADSIAEETRRSLAGEIAPPAPKRKQRAAARA